MTSVSLLIDGRQFSGWERIRVTRGIEAISGSFDLSVTDRWQGLDKPWPIVEEDECKIMVGDETLITGWVDRRRLGYSAGERRLEVSGRDKAGALVDNSAVPKTWDFKHKPILDLIKELCRPFEVSVTLDSGAVPRKTSLSVGKAHGRVSNPGKVGRASAGLGLPKPPRKWSVDPGDSVFECVDKLCRMAGLLPVSDGNGDIVLTRAGSGRASDALVEGENILDASAEFDRSTRYRTYLIRAQHPGTDDYSGQTAAAVSGSATDTTVTRGNRVLLIRPETAMTAEGARSRAAWEATVRAARGDTVGVTVQGWTQSTGEVWPVNALVSIQSPQIGVNGVMLITQAEYQLDEGGTVTRLTLRRPDAFIPDPVIRAASERVWKEIAKGV